MTTHFLEFPTTDLLPKRWQFHAEHTPDAEAIVHWSATQEPIRWQWGELWRRALALADLFRRQGVSRGDVCALIIRHHPQFYPIYLGISLLAALPAVLAFPNARLHPAKFREGLEGMARHSGLDWLLTERELEPVVRPLVERDTSTIRGILFPLDSLPDVSSPGQQRLDQAEPHEPCLLQHSSGTTGLQKAVMLSHAAVLEHVRRYSRAIGLNPADRIVSWLPLYHDMGLIAAFHLPLAAGVPVVQLDPFEWVQAPVLFLEAMARERGTLAWLPNFAYNLMADRIHDEDLAGLSLDSVRMLVNCSEPVRQESHERFVRRFAGHGLRREALAACYAMAETTFAVTQTPPGAAARKLDADAAELARGRFQPAGEMASGVRACVSSGSPIDGCVVKIIDDHGEEVPDGSVGEIVIQSVSLFNGYRNDPRKTGEVLRDGWYSSGDYGFRWQGECYIIGRKKDIIIVAGRNIYPEDVENAVNGVPDVIPGRVVAVGLEDATIGTEQVAVIAETSLTNEEARKELRRRIVETGMRIDVTIARVYLAPPRWLIKSSAGKPGRKLNRDRIAELDEGGEK